ncbi:MAG TPA: hypothetical protein VFU35_05510 [Jatrophihabitans sp.]|nr:hypothetical protein [Jatrophihabitans sp.]
MSSTARRQLLVGLATLVGLYVVIFGSAVVNSLRVVVDPTARTELAGAAMNWPSRVAAVEWDIFVVVVVLAAALKWLPASAPDIARRMGLARPSWRQVSGMLGAAAAYVGVATGSGWLGDEVVGALHLPNGSYPGAGYGVDGLLADGAASVAAAVTEEITLVALVVAVIDHGWRLLGRRPRWAAPATIATLLALRWLPHLYYLWGSMFVLFWIPPVYVLYRWVGSVWPLVVGHAAYDCVLSAEHVYPGLTPLLDRVLWLLALVGAVAIGSRAAEYSGQSGSRGRTALTARTRPGVRSVDPAD